MILNNILKNIDFSLHDFESVSQLHEFSLLSIRKKSKFGEEAENKFKTSEILEEDKGNLLKKNQNILQKRIRPFNHQNDEEDDSLEVSQTNSQNNGEDDSLKKELKYVEKKIKDKIRLKEISIITS